MLFLPKLQGQSYILHGILKAGCTSRFLGKMGRHTQALNLLCRTMTQTQATTSTARNLVSVANISFQTSHTSSSIPSATSSNAWSHSVPVFAPASSTVALTCIPNTLARTFASSTQLLIATSGEGKASCQSHVSVPSYHSQQPANGLLHVLSSMLLCPCTHGS